MDQPSAGGAYDPALEARVGRLEDHVRDIKGILARLKPMIVRIDITQAHLATRAELAELRAETRGECGAIRAELAKKRSRAYVWAVFSAPIAAYAAGLAALAALR